MSGIDEPAELARFELAKENFDLGHDARQLFLDSSPDHPEVDP